MPQLFDELEQARHALGGILQLLDQLVPGLRSVHDATYRAEAEKTLKDLGEVAGRCALQDLPELRCILRKMHHTMQIANHIREGR